MDRRPETGWPKAAVPSAVPKVPGTAPLPMPPLLHGMQHRPNIHRTRVNTGPDLSEYCHCSLGLMCNAEQMLRVELNHFSIDWLYSAETLASVRAVLRGGGHF